MLLEEMEAKNGGKKGIAKSCCSTHTDHLGATERLPSFMPFGITVPGLETYDDNDDYYRHVGVDIATPRDINSNPIAARTVNTLLSRRSEK